RERLARAYEHVRSLEHTTAELREMAGARERELDLLAFELDEIEAGDPREQGGEQLTAGRDRLRHPDARRVAAPAGGRGGSRPRRAPRRSRRTAVAGSPNCWRRPSARWRGRRRSTRD